jgi:hypothetical protein
MKPWPIVVALLGLSSLAATGCGGSAGGEGSFTCVQTSQCNAAPGGMCVQPAGHCAYPDHTCASGYRYGGASGSASGLCVASDGGVTVIPDMGVTLNPDMGVTFTPDMSVSMPPDMRGVVPDMSPPGDSIMALIGTSRFAYVGAGAVQSTSTNWRLNNSFGQGSPLGAGPSSSSNFTVGPGVLGGK